MTTHPHYAYVSNWGEDKGKRLCYETCAHQSNVKWCSECADVRKLDEIGDYIEKLLINNLDRSLDQQTLYDHMDDIWSKAEIQRATFHGVDSGRFDFDQRWRVVRCNVE